MRPAYLDGRTRAAALDMRSEVLDVRSRVTVAEITTPIRVLAEDVGIGNVEHCPDLRAVISCEEGPAEEVRPV